jgi:enolase
VRFDLSGILRKHPPVVGSMDTASRTISGISAHMILDSRGNPTIETYCCIGDVCARASVPSGASTGSHEAVELRDGGSRWGGKGVDEAIKNVINPIRIAIAGMDVFEQEKIDQELCALAGIDKRILGANATLGVSIACLRRAHQLNPGGPDTLYSSIRHLYRPSDMDNNILPVPLINILNGGAHTSSNVDIQEFMIVPHGFDDFKEAVRAGVKVYHSLSSVLKEDGLLGGIGDEGGFAPNLPTNEHGLSYVLKAIEAAGYDPGKEISIALDCAAQEFFKDDLYHIDNRELTGLELSELYSEWLRKYPIISIEDPFGEDDWDSWIEFTNKEGDRVQIVGDDLYVTNPSRLQIGIENGASNAILIKPNQIGTVTETLEVIRMAKQAGFATVISHRSGETSDDFIADLAVGTNAGQIKTGAPARSDRTSKYNQLLRIWAHIGDRESTSYADLF